MIKQTINTYFPNISDKDIINIITREKIQDYLAFEGLQENGINPENDINLENSSDLENGFDSNNGSDLDNDLNVCPLTNRVQRGDPMKSLSEELENFRNFRQDITQALLKKYLNDSNFSLMQKRGMRLYGMGQNSLESIAMSKYNIPILRLKSHIRYPRSPTAQIDSYLANNIRQAAYNQGDNYHSFLHGDGRWSYIRRAQTPQVFMTNGGAFLLTTGLGTTIALGASIIEVSLDPERSMSIENVAHEFFYNNIFYNLVTYGRYAVHLSASEEISNIDALPVVPAVSFTSVDFTDIAVNRPLALTDEERRS